MSAPPHPVRQALILCGGAGTRLHGITGDRIPKPMVPLCGRPALAYQLDLLGRHGVRDIILCTGHLGEIIEEHFGDGRELGLQLRYSREPRRLGTAGAVAQVELPLAPSLAILYGDVFVNVDLSRVFAFHAGRGGEATLLSHPSEHPHDSDLIEADEHSWRIRALPGHPRPGEPFVNRTSAALYVIERELVRHIPTDRATDFARDLFPARLAAGAALYACETDEYVHDLGTADRYPRVAADVRRMIDERSGSLFGP